MSLDEIPISVHRYAASLDPDDVVKDQPADSEPCPPDPGFEIPFPAPAVPLAPPSMEWGELQGDERGGNTPKRPGRSGGDGE